MLKVSDIAAKQLLNKNTYSFAGLPFGKKRQKVKTDLEKYDVVIAGGHLGGVLSHHFDKVVGEKANIFVAYDTPYYQYNAMRSFHEQGSFTKYDLSGSTKTGMSKHAVSSEGQGVVKYNPENNEVVLKNGRVVKYDQLVVATGMDSNYQSIKGFEEAWSEIYEPFFTNQDHSSWKTTCPKTFRYQYNFIGGEAIFYIPPAPFHGELENYNFLLSKAMWDRFAKTGRMSWDTSRLTVINANDSFCPHFEKGDTFLRSELDKHKVNVEHGLKLIEVKHETRTAVFQNLSTGELSERPYHSFYSLMPAKPQSSIAEAGLADGKGFLDVNPYTLQHKKFNNIFGLGDVTNVPTTKTFYAGFNQLHVVRNNLERNINGLPLNAEYDGTSEASVFMGIDQLSTFRHAYNGVDSGSLVSGFRASLEFKKFKFLKKKEVMDICKLKSWGPPLYKFKKTFSGSGQQLANSAQSLYPQKKSA